MSSTLVSSLNSAHRASNNNIARHSSTHKPSPVVVDNVLKLIGNTPLVKLNKLLKKHGVTCDVYAKCEFFNPGGSVKDRIGYSLMKEVADKGHLKPTTKFVEPTSGNTGIAIALNAALRGNACTVVLNTDSEDKTRTMQLLGADVVLINHDADEQSIAEEFKRADKEHVIILDQFENHLNPLTHYKTTGPEIKEALNRDVDMVAMGAGTGGTLTGVATYLKEQNPRCIVIGADPLGSMIFGDTKVYHPYLVEGIGSDSTPIVLDTSLVNKVIKITDEESFNMARDLAYLEGLLCGGSSGCAMAAAIKGIHEYKLGAGQCVVVILPDSIRNYMDKFVCDQWMEAHHFKAPPLHKIKWWSNEIIKFNHEPKYAVVPEDATCGDAMVLMNAANTDIGILVDDNNYFVAAVSKNSLRNYAINPSKLPSHKPPSEDFDFNNKVTSYRIRNCFTLIVSEELDAVDTMGRLARMLDITPFVVLLEKAPNNIADETKFIVYDVVTGADFMDYIYKQKDTRRSGFISRNQALR